MLNISKSMNYLKIHNLHPYHAKFYPGIPIYFLKKYANTNSFILDPFCGSGTTLLECNRLGFNSVGIDINFLSAKISKAKTYVYDATKVEQYINLISQSKYELDIDFKDAHIWFTNNNYKELSSIFNAIQNIKETQYKELFEVVLSSILNRVCNKRNTWNLGYLSDNILPNKENNKSLKNEFLKQCKWLIPAIKETEHLQNKATIIQTNAATFQSTEPFDVVITSPPYPFAVDFARNNRLSYYLFNQDIEKATLEETGARNKRNKKNCEIEFFNEMQQIYINIMSMLSIGGYFCMTVSDTKRKNQQINFVQWLIALFESNNWSIAEDTIRQLQHQSMGQKRIIEEHLLVFKKL